MTWHPIFHGPVILRCILEDLWTSYFVIWVSMTRHLTLYVWHCDLYYFMVQWFCRMSQRLFMLCHASALLSSLKPCTCTDKGRFGGGGGGSSTGVLSTCLALCVLSTCLTLCVLSTSLALCVLSTCLALCVLSTSLALCVLSTSLALCVLSTCLALCVLSTCLALCVLSTCLPLCVLSTCLALCVLSTCLALCVLSTCLALCVILMCMYVCWNINFSKDYLIEKYWPWNNGLVWHKDWPCKIYVGQWPIFHGPLILPFIIVIDLNYFYTLRNGSGQGYSCPTGHLLQFILQYS